MTDDLVGRQTDAEVAAKLTKAQREALRHTSITETGAISLIPRFLYSGTINALIRRGLADQGYILTDLGLRVAQHLKQENAK